MYLLARKHYENASSTLNVAYVDYLLGNMLSLRQQFDRALVCLKRSLSCYQSEGGETIELVMAMERIGTLHMNMGNHDLSKEVFEKGLDICERRFGVKNNTTADIIYGLGCIHFIQARAGCGSIDQEKAEEWLRRALQIKEDLLGDWHPEVARVLNR